MIYLKFITIILLLALSLNIVAENNYRNDDVPSISIIIDKSGSMGHNNYMNPAKQRAQNFVGLMEYGDELSVVSFNDEATVTFSRAILVDANTVGSAQTSIGGITSGGRTSMGAGFLASAGQLDGTDVLGQRAMILLSDGLDNSPPRAVDVVPELPPDIVIFTIALGTVSDIPLLQAIANFTGGQYYYLPNVAALQEIYDLINPDVRNYDLVHSQYIEDAFYETQVIDVQVDYNFDYIYFTLTSSEEDIESTTSVEFELTDPQGNNINYLNYLDYDEIDLNRGFASNKYRVEQPEQGLWSLSVNSVGYEAGNIHLTVYGKSSLNLTFSATVENEEFYINEPIELQVTLTKEINSEIVPIENANVTVELKAPLQNRSINHYSTLASDCVDLSRETDDYYQDEIININLEETEPGLYSAIFTDTYSHGNYQFRVIAEGEDNDFDFSRTLMRNVYLQPHPPLDFPQLLNPINYQTNVETSPLLTWNFVENADYYHLQVANETEIFIDEEYLTDNFYQLDDLLYNHTYMWHIRAYNSETSSYWSEVYCFTTMIPQSNAPSNLSGNLRENTVVLSWEYPETDEFNGQVIIFKVYKNGEYLTNIPSYLQIFSDSNIVAGGKYEYYVTALYSTGESDASNLVSVQVDLLETEPDVAVYTNKLYGNYPNPFNPFTSIRFSIQQESHVLLEVYDIRGRKIATLKDDLIPEGYHSIKWSGLDHSDSSSTSGIYFYRLTVDNNFVETRKMILLK